MITIKQQTEPGGIYRRKGKTMTKKIKVKNKRQLNRLVKGYRKEGYFLITYGHTLAELERDNVLVVIEL